MTEDRLKELLATSKSKDSVDSAIVRELFVEFDRLHNILAALDKTKPDLKNEIARLTITFEKQPEELAEMEKQLRNEMAEMEKQCRNARETIDKQSRLIDLVQSLLNSCLPHIRRPETADYIRKRLLHS